MLYQSETPTALLEWRLSPFLHESARDETRAAAPGASRRITGGDDCEPPPMAAVAAAWALVFALAAVAFVFSAVP
jgi:hypothetical protein